MKALVVRAGALGDLLLLRPVVAALREVRAEVTLLAPPQPGSALVGSAAHDAHALLSWDRSDIARLLGGGSTRAETDRFPRFDVALCYSRSADLVRRLESIAGRVVALDPQPPPAHHAADWYMRPLRDLGIPPVDAEPLYPNTTPEALDVLEQLPAAFVAIHPGSGSPRKNWPAERFVELARRVAQGRWLLSLGPADAREAEVLGATPLAVVTRDLPPRALGAVLSQAAAYVGNDSGVTHLAAACGTPTVALFGPTDPRTWAPRGPHVSIVASEDGTMTSIAVEDVAKTVEIRRRTPVT